MNQPGPEKLRVTLQKSPPIKWCRGSAGNKTATFLAGDFARPIGPTIYKVTMTFPLQQLIGSLSKVEPKHVFYLGPGPVYTQMTGCAHKD